MNAGYLKNKYKTLLILFFIVILAGIGSRIFNKKNINNVILEGTSKTEIIISMYREDKRSLFPKAADVSVEEVVKFISKEKIVLVDVREGYEQKVSMIKGAVTKKNFEKNIDKYKNHTIVVYCTIGNRSGRYISNFKDKRFKVYNLIGGILSWVNEGRKVYSNNEAVKRVHVFGDKWNLLPDNYEAVW